MQSYLIICLGRNLFSIWESYIFIHFSLGSSKGLSDLMGLCATEIVSVHATFKYDCWFWCETYIHYSVALKGICWWYLLCKVSLSQLLGKTELFYFLLVTGWYINCLRMRSLQLITELQRTLRNQSSSTWTSGKGLDN